VEANFEIYSTELLDRRWLSRKSIELRLAKPPLFRFDPGQRICLIHNSVERDYSIVTAPTDPDLILCIRKVDKGILSPRLSEITRGTRLQFTGPHGYFTFKPSHRPAIFVATGTGLAPFCSMVRSGITDIALLHGVSLEADLYYADLMRPAVKRYIPCLSEPDGSPQDYFSGRVTDYLQNKLAPGEYDFYLCGSREMIHDVTLLIDERFEGSLIYTEIYY
jgi:ferredoxin-NADP reductase